MKQLLFILLVVWVNSAYSQQIGQLKLVELSSEKELNVANILESGHSVIIFNSIECPFDKYYVKRIQSIANNSKFKEVKFILVNPTSKEAWADIKAQNAKSNSGLEYYLDRSQTLFNSFSLSKTPEAVFFQMRNGIAEVIYKGAIDNNPQMAEAVTENYLSDAISAALNGKKIKKNYVRPMGCVVKSN